MKERVYNIVRHSAGQLRRELPKRTRFLIFFFEPFSGELQICWPLNDVPKLTPELSAVVKDCFSNPKEITLEDSSASEVYPSLSHQESKSIIVLPLLDVEEHTMGVVYIDHPEARGIGQAELHQLREFVGTQQSRIPHWSWTHELPETEEFQTGFNPLFTMVGLASVLVFCYLFLISPQPRPTPTRPPNAATSSPLDAASTFRALLVRRDIANARQWMSTDLQQQKSGQQMLRWLEIHNNGYELGHRELVVDANDGKAATVILLPDPQATDSRWRSPIRLEMIRYESGWTIREIVDQGNL